MTNPLPHKEVIKVLKKLEELWPDVQCELKHNTPFQLLIAVVLSAQTTDKAVNKALEPVLAANPSFGPSDVVSLGEKGFLDLIKTIGLAPTKSKNCVALSKIIMEKFNGTVPNTREELESLPGVGRKTAHVVMNVLWNAPVIAVDTHVHRVSQRLGLVVPSKDRLNVEQQLVQGIPESFLPKISHLLVFHGRYHCLARAPKCSTCGVFKMCLRFGVSA